MLGTGGSSSSGSLAGSSPSASSRPNSSSSSSGYDMSAQGTLAAASTILRWERLVGRLAARIAQRKAALLLQWLQLHAAFADGCRSRRTWLSERVGGWECMGRRRRAVAPRCASAVGMAPFTSLHCNLAITQALDAGAAPAADAVLPAPWTFRSATQQLVAYLLTLHIPGVRPVPGAHPLGAASSSCGSASGRGPQHRDDFLWWTQASSSSSSSSCSSSSCEAMLDSVVGVLYELSGLSAQEEAGTPGDACGGGVLLEAVRQVCRGLAAAEALGC
jgi:hypothetical protein